MKRKAWVVSVEMGYGHQRAASPLSEIACERIITANSDKWVSQKDRRVGNHAKLFYDFVSRMRSKGIIGTILFWLYDRMQQISPFYPFADLSRPTYSVLYLKQLCRRGFCKSLLHYLEKEKIPLITTHFAPAMAAEYHGIRNGYCIITDTDIHRIWVTDHPEKSTIQYLAPCEHVVQRLREYGVSPQKIFFTGFPLPKDNIGKKLEFLKRDLSQRLYNLDPNRVFIRRHAATIRQFLHKLPSKSKHTLTLMYAVGGAGAEYERGVRIMKSLTAKLKRKEVRLILVAATHPHVYTYYAEEIKKAGLASLVDESVIILHALDKKQYFSTFNSLLRSTDILWTKPSELSFYCALGIPLIIAPPLGAHEIYNKQWLEHMGAGFDQENPDAVSDWLFYWLKDGRLAEAAWDGLFKAPTLGTYRIEELVLRGKKPVIDPAKLF